MYITHHEEISNALNTRGLIWKQKCFELAAETVNDGSRRLSVREFQVVGPATEKTQRLYVDLV